MILQGGTVLVAELDFDEVFEYDKHHRLGVFCRKGTECVCCGEKGMRFIVSADNGGGVHYDVYSDNYSLITVDHDIALGVGGSDEFKNKVPMCSDCNYAKSSRNMSIRELKEFMFNKYSKISLDS